MGDYYDQPNSERTNLTEFMNTIQDYENPSESSSSSSDDDDEDEYDYEEDTQYTEDTSQYTQEQDDDDDDDEEEESDSEAGWEETDSDDESGGGGSSRSGSEEYEDEDDSKYTEGEFEDEPETDDDDDEDGQIEEYEEVDEVEPESTDDDDDDDDDEIGESTDDDDDDDEYEDFEDEYEEQEKKENSKPIPVPSPSPPPPPQATSKEQSAAKPKETTNKTRSVETEVDTGKKSKKKDKKGESSSKESSKKSSKESNKTSEKDKKKKKRDDGNSSKRKKSKEEKEGKSSSKGNDNKSSKKKGTKNSYAAPMRPSGYHLQDEQQNNKADLKKEREALIRREHELADREVAIVRRETKITRWLIVFCCCILLAAGALVTIYILDPFNFGDESPAPVQQTSRTQMPSVAPFDDRSPPFGLENNETETPTESTTTISPTLLPTIQSTDTLAVTTSYNVLVPSGKADDVSIASLVPDLVASMDALGQDVVDELQQDEIIIRKNRRLRGMRTIRQRKLETTIQVPTSIESAQEIVCPDLAPSDSLCLEISARIVLVTEDGSDPLNDGEFLSALETAIEDGRLDEALESVASDSPLYLYSGTFTLDGFNASTNSPTLTGSPTMTPSPVDDTTGAPSQSPSPSETGQFTNSPTVAEASAGFPECMEADEILKDCTGKVLSGEEVNTCTEEYREAANCNLEVLEDLESISGIEDCSGFYDAWEPFVTIDGCIGASTTGLSCENVPYSCGATCLNGQTCFNAALRLNECMSKMGADCSNSVTAEPSAFETFVPSQAPSNDSTAPSQTPSNGFFETTSPSSAPSRTPEGSDPPVGNESTAPSQAPDNSRPPVGDESTTPSQAPGNGSEQPGGGIETTAPSQTPEGSDPPVGNESSAPSQAPDNTRSPVVDESTAPSQAPGNGSEQPGGGIETAAPSESTITPPPTGGNITPPPTGGTRPPPPPPPTELPTEGNVTPPPTDGMRPPPPPPPTELPTDGNVTPPPTDSTRPPPLTPPTELPTEGNGIPSSNPIDSSARILTVDDIQAAMDAYNSLQGANVQVSQSIVDDINTVTAGYILYRQVGFIAQTLWESAGFQYTEELAAVTPPFLTREEYQDCDWNTPGIQFPNNGKFYYGRGYMQLSWCANYIAYGRDRMINDDPDYFYNFPELVAQSPYAMDSAAWFFETIATDVTGRFGLLTNAINGALECNGGSTIPDKRYQIFEALAIKVGLVGYSSAGC